MEYCLGDADGSATMWTAEPDTDTDGDGVLDAVGLDLDGDGRLDDALSDRDGDGLAELAGRDLDDDDVTEAFFSDDGSGTWMLSVDRTGQVRWFGLDGVEQTGDRWSTSTPTGRSTTGSSTATATGWPTR